MDDLDDDPRLRDFLDPPEQRRIRELESTVERLRAANRVLKNERSRLRAELQAVQDVVNATVYSALHE